MRITHIIICSVFGLVLLTAAYFTIRDIIRIVKQLRAFSRTTGEVGIFSGDTRSPDDIARDVGEKLKSIKENDKDKADHYVIQRLDFAVTMVGREEGAHTQLPSVDEWYAREVEEENSRPSVCVSRTLIASLLIMGIVGTLICLHAGYLAGINNGEFSNLHEALQPSLWAIGGTIILLILRGIYRVVFERLEGRINCYTLEVILPCLQLSTNEEEMEENMTETVDVLNHCIHRIKDNLDQGVAPFIEEIGRYKRGMEGLLDVLGGCCDTVVEAAKKMEENAASSKKQVQQIRDAYQKVLPALREADGLLTAIPDRLRDLQKMLQDHLKEVAALSDNLSAAPKKRGRHITAVKKVLDELRQQYSQAQAKTFAIRTHDQQSLSVHILNEAKALETTKAAMKGPLSLMEETIKHIRALSACLQGARDAYTETTYAQVGDMEECKKKLDTLRMQLDARKQQIDSICRHYRAYRRPWLFLNRRDLLASSLLLLLLILKLFFFEL